MTDLAERNLFRIPFSFQLAQFRYTLLPEKDMYLPFIHRGHILRGAFGSSLKRMVCINPRVECRDCRLKNECAYFLIFAPSSLTGPLRFKDTPRGFVIKPSLDRVEVFTKDNPFFFEIVLVGNRIQYHPWIILPLNALGTTGIGPRRDRFEILDIEALKNGHSVSIYDYETKVIRNISIDITNEDFQSQISHISGDTLTLEFLTPTRIRYNPTGEKGKSHVVRVPEFHHVLKRLRDRVNVLSTVYGDGPMDLDFKEFGRRAERIKIAEANVKWIDIKRKSRTQGTWHDQSGFIGTVTYTGKLEEFLPFLVVGQYIHVGEDAVFGSGWYRIVK